ncbi:electron transfer flavoprotein subunit alpha/FixB family protein [bacterium]|nr:electron transfer flavoprotein subunit alpha/FixB family protein [bacterium]
MAVWLLAHGGADLAGLARLGGATGAAGACWLGEAGDWGTLGVSTVLHLEGADPATGATALADRLGADDLLLAGHDRISLETVSRWAALVGAGISTSCLGATCTADGATLIKHGLGGQWLFTVEVKGGAATFLTRQLDASARPPGDPKVEVVPPGASPAGKVETLEESVAAEAAVDLSSATVIVSGGRGLGSPAGFTLVKELAGRLGGAVGASRAVVDMGWIPYSHQVGQTGRTVSPKLYIALGISGAVQHRAGMQNSGLVVAVNTDANAPIFKICDYGLVADWREVSEAWLKALA